MWLLCIMDGKVHEFTSHVYSLSHPMIYYKQVVFAIILCIVELVCQIVVVNVVIYCGQIIHLDEQMDEKWTYLCTTCLHIIYLPIMNLLHIIYLLIIELNLSIIHCWMWQNWINIFHNNNDDTFTKIIILWRCGALVNDLIFQHGGEGFNSLSN